MFIDRTQDDLTSMKDSQLYHANSYRDLHLHCQGSGAHGTILGIQQDLEDVLQHLILRRARRTSKDRRHRRAGAPLEAEAIKRGYC